MTPAQRHQRFHRESGSDQRNPTQRDRDRIIHSSALRRLAGVTQVVDPAEGYVFHNRLTHTLKVAQIGRRLAERLTDQQREPEQAELAEVLGGIDPEVVETAALAHDLGHPPFGHITEKKLDALVKSNNDDGFEGNAQSFRIVTKLSVRRDNTPGVNLTRASLNALLKYPWFRATDGPKREKWGAYHSEEDEFEWVRKFNQPGETFRSPEAELMDWADDIAYAVHDMEDFYRAGLVLLHLLAGYELERERFLTAVAPRLTERVRGKPYSVEDLHFVFHELMEFVPVSEGYQGSLAQRAALRTATAQLIARYVFGIDLREPGVDDRRPVRIEQQHEMEVYMLKQLTWHYVIDNPALASQQYGRARVISNLFDIFMEAALSKASGRDSMNILPIRCRERLEAGSDEKRCARLVSDVISSLSDREALAFHTRFIGSQPGSVFEAIGR